MKTMKMKLTSIALVIAMVIAALGVMTVTNSSAYAAENEITVYVTISDKGELAVDANGQTMAYVPVTVPADANGTATVDAVMVAFHEKYCPGGYATEEGAWGKTVALLWNVANDYGYSFAINNTPLSLGVGQDVVGDGGYVYGYVMKDITYWSDTFAFAEAESSTVKIDEPVAVNFSYIGYDPTTWEATELPLADVAVKAVGEEDVLATTNAEGKAEFTFAEAGTYIVYAENPEGAAATFSAPACVITVEADEEEELTPGGSEEGVVDPEGEEPEQNDEEEPVAEEDPADEEEPVVEEETEETEKAPATGDASQMAMYLMLMMAAAGTAFVVKKQK